MVAIIMETAQGKGASDILNLLQSAAISSNQQQSAAISSSQQQTAVLGNIQPPATYPKIAGAESRKPTLMQQGTQGAIGTYETTGSAGIGSWANNEQGKRNSR